MRKGECCARDNGGTATSQNGGSCSLENGGCCFRKTATSCNQDSETATKENIGGTDKDVLSDETAALSTTSSSSSGQYLQVLITLSLFGS